MTARPYPGSMLTLPMARSVFSACILCLAATAAAAQTTPAAAPAPAASPAPARNNRVDTKLDEVVREFARDPRFKSQSEDQVRETIEFVAGNVIFATVHEVGHMLVTELGLPVLGREEDAVDSFAVLTGLKLNSALSDRILTQSARGWFLSDRRAKKDKIKMVFYDEHGLDQQRAYNIVCLMVGANPAKFSALADLTKMPEERQGRCQGDFSNASWSWEKVLAPHLRKPDQAKTPVTVKYGDTTKYQIYQRGFRQIGIFEALAEHISDRFVLRAPVAIEMSTCDEPGARWDLTARKIFVCYELAAEMSDLYRRYAGEPKLKAKTASRKH
jgi:hypothetical protein